MELRHLRSFVALAEDLHFGRAAQRLFLAQPALSKQIAALERELGVALFTRDKRQVVPTPAGRALLADARRVLEQADGAVRRAREAGRGTTGELRIGFIAPALYGLLPPLLREFRRRYPGVRLTLEEMHNQEAIDAVLSRRAQLGLIRLPIEQHDDLTSVPVSTEDVLVAVPRHSPLAARESLRLADLADSEVILIGRALEPELHDYYVTRCAEAGFTARVAHEVDRTHVALGLVASGLGVCFAPASARRIAPPEVVCVPLVGSGLALTMAALWSDDSPLLRHFLSLCLPGADQVPGDGVA